MTFHGLPTHSLSNAYMQLDMLAEAGPRLVRLMLTGANQNLLAELPAVGWDTPYGEYRVYGGHRLWHAPEVYPRTYIPDNQGLSIQETPDGLLLMGTTEPDTHIQKSIEIHINPDRPALTLVHTIANAGAWAVELALWAITQLPLGGVIILPQNTKTLVSDVLPNRHIVLWPYTSWKDPRLECLDDFILLYAQPAPPVKIGYMNHHGWTAYLRQGVLLLKRFDLPSSQPYPDLGCNVESYCNDQAVELETLGPLTRIKPGASLMHSETWELFAGLDYPETIDGVRALADDLELI